jgi:cytochrome c-type biogenesis protein CcmH
MNDWQARAAPLATLARPTLGRVLSTMDRAAVRRLLCSLCWLLTLLLPTFVLAADAVPVGGDPKVEARLARLAVELRCLVCQNQTIADSSAALAVDLRNQIREMIARGDTDEQILEYMTARYGDFVLYRPPLKATTTLLWTGPALLMIVGFSVLGLALRRRRRLSPEQFEADEVEPESAAGTERQ